MARILGVVAFLAITTVGMVRAQVTPSPYAGQHRQSLKAISAEEIAMYLAGEGMGFAKPAELNHYPGPRHVIDLAGQLGVSADQVAAMQAIFDRMRAEAIRLGAEIIAGERRLDSLFAHQTIDEEQLRALTTELAALQGELRFTHLRAHLAVTALLSAQQVQRYDELRGYGTGGHEHRP